MWTEHDPIANRVNLMNLSADEARALCASLANATHYARLLRREPNAAMEQLRAELQLTLYGCTENGPCLKATAARVVALKNPHR